MLDEDKLNKTNKLYKQFKSGKKANKLLSLQQFVKFKDTTEALTSTTALIEGKMSKKLKKILKKVVVKEEDQQLAVADKTLATAIKQKFNIDCVSTGAIHELMTCIRSQIENLIPEWNPEDDSAMQLGLSHG